MDSTWKSRAEEIQSLLDQGMTTRQIAARYGVPRKTMQNRISELRGRGLLKSRRPTLENVAQLPDYKASVEIMSDGSHKSDKLLRMSDEQVKDVDFLLAAHGYDKEKWTLTGARSNIWNSYSKQDGIMTLYSSKITVKPKENGTSLADLMDAIRAEVKPVYFNVLPRRQGDGMLEIPLYDMHLGNCDMDFYRDTQERVARKIESHKWEENIFIIGQDLLHHDNFKSSTSNGTVIANANMKQAVEDAKQFYYPLIEIAASQANGNVKIIYSKGNHDESMSYMFVQVLKERFPQLRFDDEIRERKVHVYKKCFIGITHGDKARKALLQLFPAEFPLEWAATTLREIHAGDLHREDIKGHDEFGVMFRTLSTKNKTDDWHDDNGYTTAHKRFMLFEYSDDWLEDIRYV